MEKSHVSKYVKPSELNEKLLPRPFVEGREMWRTLHDFTWRCAFDHIHRREGLASPHYIYNALNPEYQWVWDTCFISLYTRYLPDLYPGIQSLDNFYAWQRDDGYISMTYIIQEGKEAYGERVNPPLFGWAEWEHYRTTGRTERIRRVLPHLIRHFDWLFHNRRRVLNLYWFEDAGSSGMDNSPRGRRNAEAGKQMGWVDLSSQVAQLALCISRLARVIGDTGVAGRFHDTWEFSAKWVQRHCWCPRSGFYHDRLDDSNWLGSKTAAGFWPLVAEFAEPAQAAALAAHLENPATFGRPCPVPTLSYDDPNYVDSGAYWLGGVWAPTNYMIFAGLRKYGHRDLARRLAAKYLDHVARTWEEYAPHPKTIWEVYSPEKPEPSVHERSTKSVSMYDFIGWSGLGPTAMLYEDLLGLDVDVPAGTLTWDVGLTEGHGVENFPFGAGRIDLEAGARKAPDAPARIRVKSTVDLTLVARCAGREKRLTLRRGRAVAATV
jgi:hypothetical protein